MDPSEYVNRHFRDRREKEAKGTGYHSSTRSSRITEESYITSEYANSVPSTEVSYFNFTSLPFTVTTRDRSSFILPPLFQNASRVARKGQQIVIRLTRSMSVGQMEEALQHLIDREMEETDESSVWRRAYSSTLQHRRRVRYGEHVTATVEYVYDESVITKDCQGRAYLTDVDLLVESTEDAGMSHPYDTANRDKTIADDLVPISKSDQTAAFVFKAVDNSDDVRYTTRYINLGGQIYRIPVERDLKYSTGVHVVSREPLEGNRFGGMITRHYTFEEADKTFGLYHSIEEARNGGPITDRVKHLVEVETANRKLEELQLQNEKLERERELHDKRMVAEEQKVERQIEQSKQRSWTEWMRLVIGAIGTIVGAIQLLQKLKTSK